MTRGWVFVAVLIAAMLPMCPVRADEAQGVFNDLYGQQLAKVKRTAGKTDDLEFATELLAKAATIDDPQLMAAMCDNAYALSRQTSKGYQTSVEAMLLLAQRVPDQAAHCRENLLAVAPKMYANRHGEEKAVAGRLYVRLLDESAAAHVETGRLDEAVDQLKRASTIAKVIGSDPFGDFKAKLDRVVERRRVTRLREQLEAQLVKNPSDSAAGQKLAMLHVVELDDPAGAKRYIDIVGEETRQTIDQACQPVEQLSATECGRLADWYRDLGEQAGALHRPAMLRRAIGYYERVVHTQNTSMDTARVALTLDNLKGQLASNDRKTVDVLALIDPVQDAIVGGWHWEGTMLQAEPVKMGHLQLPVIVDGSYELCYQFCRVGGDRRLHMAVPVGDRKAYIALAARVKRDLWRSGIGEIDGDGALTNDTTVDTLKIRNDTLYTVRVTVELADDDATIGVAVNNQPVLRWRGPQSSVRMDQTHDTNRRRIRTPNMVTIGAAQCEVNYHMIKLRMLDGTARLLRPVVPAG